MKEISQHLYTISYKITNFYFSFRFMANSGKREIQASRYNASTKRKNDSTIDVHDLILVHRLEPHGRLVSLNADST